MLMEYLNYLLDEQKLLIITEIISLNKIYSKVSYSYHILYIIKKKGSELSGQPNWKQFFFTQVSSDNVYANETRRQEIRKPRVPCHNWSGNRQRVAKYIPGGNLNSGHNVSKNSLSENKRDTSNIYSIQAL